MKQKIYELLRERGFWHVITEHPAVYNMEEMGQVELPYAEADAKNLFVRDDKKRNYYLITVIGSKRVDLKEFKKKQGTRSLTFASAEELLQFLKLTPGAVTPLGLLNDAECHRGHEDRRPADAAAGAWYGRRNCGDIRWTN